MNSLQKSYHAFIESVCKQFDCTVSIRPLQEGFSTLCESAGDRVGELSIEPGWPEQFMETDYAARFPKCPYAREFFDMLKSALMELGTLTYGEPIRVGDRMVDCIRMGGMEASRETAEWPEVKITVPVTGRGKECPLADISIGSLRPLGNNFEIRSVIRWVPGPQRGNETIPGSRGITVSRDNMEEVVREIVDRVQWYLDNKLDLDAVSSMVSMHRRWLSHRARNVADLPLGKKFIDRFTELSESTPVYSWKNVFGDQYNEHGVRIAPGRELNKVGINKMDIVCQHGKGSSHWPYTLRCTSNGALVLVGASENVDYGSVLITEDNWQEVCDDVFREACEIEKEGLAREAREKAQEQAREAGRVRCDRERIRAKFGDFLYNKFFDVVDDGELAGKSTDEIITDMKCAIAEDRSEYDLMAKQDRIRAGRE